MILLTNDERLLAAGWQKYSGKWEHNKYPTRRFTTEEALETLSVVGIIADMNALHEAHHREISELRDRLAAQVEANTGIRAELEALKTKNPEIDWREQESVKLGDGGIFNADERLAFVERQLLNFLDVLAHRERMLAETAGRVDAIYKWIGVDGYRQDPDKPISARIERLEGYQRSAEAFFSTWLQTVETIGGNIKALTDRADAVEKIVEKSRVSVEAHSCLIYAEDGESRIDDLAEDINIINGTIESLTKSAKTIEKRVEEVAAALKDTNPLA